MPRGEALQTVPDLPTEEDRTYTIGDLAEEFGLTLRTIRFYEDHGLLAPQRAGTVRLYGYRDRARLMLICRGKRLGFSLAEIREFLDLYDVDQSQVEQMRYALALARKRIAALRRQLEDGRMMLADLGQIEADIVSHLQECGVNPDAALARKPRSSKPRKTP